MKKDLENRSLSDFAKPIPGNENSSYIPFPADLLDRPVKHPKIKLRPSEHFIPGSKLGSTYLAFPSKIKINIRKNY